MASYTVGVTREGVAKALEELSLVACQGVGVRGHPWGGRLFGGGSVGGDSLGEC